MAFVNIKYSESGKKKKNLGYKGVEITFENGTMLFNSGNFVIDWYDMRKLMIQELNNESCSHSSSIDHFIHDGAPYDSAYLHIEGGNPILKYVNKTNPLWFNDELIDGIEFFVPQNTQPTWAELRKLCNDEKK